MAMRCGNKCGNEKKTQRLKDGVSMMMRVSRRKRVRNDVIRDRGSAQQTILERIEIKRSKWFRHLMRMEQERLFYKGEYV